MSVITADKSIRDWLAEIKRITEIRDESGKVLGTFLPTEESEEELYERAKKLFDPVEMERVLREGKGKEIPYSEVMRRLKAMEKK